MDGLAESLEIMTDAMRRCPSPMGGLAIVPYLGAVARVDAAATAFAHRAPGYSLLIVSQWTDEQDTEKNVAWAKGTFDLLRPHMTDRSYVNNLISEDGRKVEHVWGANSRRLVSVKRRYDPANVFRLNHNIDPWALASIGRLIVQLDAVQLSLSLARAFPERPHDGFGRLARALARGRRGAEGGQLANRFLPQRVELGGVQQARLVAVAQLVG